MNRPLRRVLVANRGEIAVRIVRACHDEALEAIVAVSDADEDSLAARLADGVVHVGPPSPAQSWPGSPSPASRRRSNAWLRAWSPGRPEHAARLDEAAVLPHCLAHGKFMVGSAWNRLKGYALRLVARRA